MAESRSSFSRDDYKYCDDPPMSRLFVIYNKTCTEDDFRESFGKYGDIEDIWILKDKGTGENKGVAYIKFNKSSEAARALEELNGKCIGSGERPIKVLIASSRQAGSKKLQENEQERYARLFIVVSKSLTEDDIREEFSRYGDVEHVSIIKDRATGQNKGFGYVKYHRLYHAALAFENCPSKYKAVFAEPKSKNPSGSDYNSSRGDRGDDSSTSYGRASEMANFLKLQTGVNQPTSLEVVCSNRVNQDQLWRLFDIIPGLDYCQVIRECGPRNLEATVVFNNPEAALYAREKLHGLEYPPGERLIVKIAAHDSRGDSDYAEKKIRKDSMCNVELPPQAPMAASDATVAKRCFIVLTSSLPDVILKYVFSTFGNLIDVYLLPKKNCGYAKYAAAESAQRAINTLNGAEICGVRIKVMEAQEPNEDGRKRMRWDCDSSFEHT